MFKKLRRFFCPCHTDVTNLQLNQLVMQNHLIAAARLSFITPDVLAREAQNNQANMEYLQKMFESLGDNGKPGEKVETEKER